MSIVKIEMLSDKNLKAGDRLYCHFIEDAMQDEDAEIRDKYNLRFLNTNSESCGFGLKDSLFSRYSAGDIVQAMYDLEINFKTPIEFEVISIKDITKNKKRLFLLKLLDINIANRILGISLAKKTELDLKKYLTNDIKSRFSNLNKNKSDIETVTLNVKGDVKSNPKRTTIARLIKNSEKPAITLCLDDDGCLRTKFEGEYAGEVIDVPKELCLENIISVECANYISFGYTILVKFTTDNKFSDNCISEDDCISSNKLESEQLSIFDTNKDKDNRAVAIKKFKADEKELTKIIEYLNDLNIPEYLIKKILSKHQPYEERYLNRIPHSLDKNFRPWKRESSSKNLLLLAIVSTEEGLNQRFVGGKGAGKDTLLQTLGWIYQRPIFTQSSNMETDTADLFGDKNLEPKIINGTPFQTIGFEVGLLIEAMEVGGFYEFGEGNACKPGVTMAIHTVLDHRRSMDVNGYKLVKSHPNFSFILTMNIDYEGCNPLNQAFQDRFTTIKFPPPKDISVILKDACDYASDRDIFVCNKIYQSLLELSSEFQSDDIVTIRGYIHALQMARHIPIADALECCIINNISDDILISEKIKHVVENLVE